VKRRPIRLPCAACGVMSPAVAPASPAAPLLTACEALHRDHGWSYVVGFAAMLTGDHEPRCPACHGGAR
jgi:hypothetical protein